MSFQPLDDSLVYLNGEYLPMNEAKISPLDRGFIFGDGIYDVVPFYNGHPFMMKEHVARLQSGLNSIRIHTGKTDQDWFDLFLAMAQRTQEKDFLVYVQVTRGVAKRIHQFPQPAPEPTVFMMVSKYRFMDRDLKKQGISAVTLEDRRWLHCDIKSVSLLGHVLSQQYAIDHGAEEVVMFRQGILSEGSHSNVWVVKDGQVFGAIPDHRVLKGIRYYVLPVLCEQVGVPLTFKEVTYDQVMAADELFITSAGVDITPVTSLNGVPIGTGQAGPVSESLVEAFFKMKEDISQ